MQTSFRNFHSCPGNPGGPRGIRFVSHNVFWFQGSSFATDEPPSPRGEIVEALCALYREMRADVLCLQEVQSEAAARRIADFLDMEWIFRPGGGHPQYGGAVFSRWPMRELPLEGAFVVDRTLLRVEVRPREARPYCLVNIHLPSHRQHGVEGGQKRRLEELGRVVGEVKTDMLLGDFNERPGGPCSMLLREGGRYHDVAIACFAGEMPTNLSKPPGFRGDQIWLSNSRNGDLAGYFCVSRKRLSLRHEPGTFLSDHLPIGCELHSSRG